MGPAVEPQLFFFALFFTILTSFFSFATLFASGFTPYLIAAMVVVLWYETARLWRKLAV